MCRVVKQKDDTILLDKTGKKAGRGAYICPNITCLQSARKARRLEKAFACRISDEVYAALEEAMLQPGDEENNHAECS